MPDTLSREELAAIRETFAHRPDIIDSPGTRVVQSLLAHIDALTAAVEELPPSVPGPIINGCIDRAAVLAILRGEQ